MSQISCVIWPDEYLSLQSFRAMRGRSLDVMGIDESVALKAVNNGPFFCFVLFSELQKQESQTVGVVLLSLTI